MFKERLKTTPTVKVMEAIHPYLLISEEALIEMQLYVKECKDEIGWLGSIEQIDERCYLLNHVFLFDQEVHATTTEITPEGLSDFAEEILQLEDGIELWNSMRLWGHSHVNMPINPSGQDDKQMEEFKQGGNPHFFRLIANKQGELKVDFYDYEKGLEFHDIPWGIKKSNEECDMLEEIALLQSKIDALRNEKIAEIQDSVKEEMKEKVRTKTFVYTSNKGQLKPYDLTKAKYDVGFSANFDYSWSDTDIYNSFTPTDFELFAVMSLEEIEEEIIEYGYRAQIDYDIEDLKAIKRFAEKYQTNGGYEYELYY